MSTFMEYKAYLQNKGFTVLTVKIYIADAEEFASWFEKQNQEVLEPARVTTDALCSYRSYLQETLQHKASTVNRKLASVSSWLNWAVETEQIPFSPMSNVKYVSRERRAPIWLDKDQQQYLQQTMENDLRLAQMRYPKRWRTRRRDASLVIFMLNTGLLLSETISLRLEDIRISDDGGEVLVRQRGGRERSIPLKADVRESLREWLKVRPQDTDDYLWITTEEEANGRLTPRAVQRILMRYGQDAGIPKLTPQILRSTFARNLAEKNVGVEIIASLLGHSNLLSAQVFVDPMKLDERSQEAIGR